MADPSTINDDVMQKLFTAVSGDDFKAAVKRPALDANGSIRRARTACENGRLTPARRYNKAVAALVSAHADTLEAAEALQRLLAANGVTAKT